MDFMNWIVDKFNLSAVFFYDIYLETFDWISPFKHVSGIFYELSWVSGELAWAFSGFFSWLLTKTDEIDRILSWDTIKDYIVDWLRWLESPLSWFVNLWYEVWDEILTWWDTTTETVQGWIDAAKQDVLSVVDTVSTTLASLQAAWDDFKSRIPTIDEVIYWWRNWPGDVLSVVNTWWTSTMGEVQGLIDSAFILREGFWAGWQDWRDQVTEFFTDPEEWLYKSVDRIVERFW